MKKLIILLLVCISAGMAAQDCFQDSVRFAEYNYMEVFNHKKKAYEKFTKTDEIEVKVIVDVEKMMISFTDPKNNYNKEYRIFDCIMEENTLTYSCFDISNERRCSFIFSTDKSLTIIYSCEPVVYRVKNK